jgi:hypothetical protein
VTLSGAGTCEAKTGKLLSLTLVGYGVYRSDRPNDAAKKYGAIVDWRLKR